MIIEKCLRYTRAPVSARINPCPLFSTSVFDNFAEISWKFLKFLIGIFLHPLQILSLKSLNFTFLNFKKSRLICLSIFIAHVSYQSKEIEQIKQKKRLELRSLTLRRSAKTRFFADYKMRRLAVRNAVLCALIDTEEALWSGTSALI